MSNEQTIIKIAHVLKVDHRVFLADELITIHNDLTRAIEQKDARIAHLEDIIRHDAERAAQSMDVPVTTIYRWFETTRDGLKYETISSEKPEVKKNTEPKDFTGAFIREFCSTYYEKGRFEFPDPTRVRAALEAAERTNHVA